MTELLTKERFKHLPHHLWSYGRQGIHFIVDYFNRNTIEAHYRRNPPPIAYGASKVILFEGMWDNPNHWLRSWMFLHAILKGNEADVIGILRSRGDVVKKRSLKALGIRRFVYLSDAFGQKGAFLSQAEGLLRHVENAHEMLNLKLPNDLPAYIYYDTLIKLAKHPQPVVKDNPLCSKVLTEVLSLGKFYRDIFEKQKVMAVVSSHPWKNEYASLCWTALERGIPFYYMTAHYNSIRIHKMSAPKDYRAPNEHMSYQEFCSLPVEVRNSLIERGKAYLEDRFKGDSDFVVIRYAMDPSLRNIDKAQFLRKLGLSPEKPLVVIYAHSWFDFPHAQAMSHFTDPLDWIQLTIETVTPLNDINWAIKPHPCDQWYGCVNIHDLVKKELPPHITILPEPSDSLAIQSLADVLVTIHGSIAIEAAALGKPVLCADRSYYTDWGFTHTAASREDYVEKLRHILSLEKPTAEQSRKAMAYGSTNLGTPPEEEGYLKLPCDSLFLEGVLYDLLRKMLCNDMRSIYQEIERIREWLSSSHSSFNVWRIVHYYSQRSKVNSERC
jgi:hypothetical protein